MKKTLEEYKALMAAEAEKTADAKKKVAEAKKAYEEATGALSDAESVQRSAEYALHSHNINKLWMILMGVALAMDVAIPCYGLYWLKSEDNFWRALGHNGVPAILAVVSLAIWALGIFFLLQKKKKGKVFAKALEDAKEKCEAAQRVKTDKEAILNLDTDALEGQKKAEKALKDEFYTVYPEELEKINEQKRQAEEAARKEYEDKQERERKEAEAYVQRQRDLTEAQKMFEHPQAYVMDGQFENDFKVYEKSAEMGCQDAQIRVVETYLGISYKSGVKVDVAKGEEIALRFADQGSFVFYEILGKGFLYGEGGMTKDEAKGLKYLEKAAGRGRQKAMMMAAVCHYNGVGTEKNEERARKFFEHAAKQGNEQAIQVIVAMNNGEKLRF